MRALALLAFAATWTVEDAAPQVVYPPYTAHHVFPYSLSQLEDSLATQDDDGVTNTNDDDDRTENDDFRVEHRFGVNAIPTPMPSARTPKPTALPTPLPAPKSLTMAEAMATMKGGGSTTGGAADQPTKKKHSLAKKGAAKPSSPWGRDSE